MKKFHVSVILSLLLNKRRSSVYCYTHLLVRHDIDSLSNDAFYYVSVFISCRVFFSPLPSTHPNSFCTKRRTRDKLNLSFSILYVPNLSTRTYVFYSVLTRTYLLVLRRRYRPVFRRRPALCVSCFYLRARTIYNKSKMRIYTA